MKKKNDSSEIVTRGILREELSHLKTDINQLRADMDHLRIDIDEKAREYRDDVLTKMDKVIGELEGIREDSVIGRRQTEDLRVDVEDLKSRVKKIEKAN